MPHARFHAAASDILDPVSVAHITAQRKAASKEADPIDRTGLSTWE
jgi:hypothetical protein